MFSVSPNLPIERLIDERTCGVFRWVERQLGQVLEVWSDLIPEPELKKFLEEQSRQHIWHGEIWSGRLSDPVGYNAPPNSGVGLMFRDLHDGGEKFTALQKLVTVYRVLLPRLVSEYTAHLDPKALNDPVQRGLRLILTEEHESWRAGEILIQDRIKDRSGVFEASSQQEEFELRIVEFDGFATLLAQGSPTL